MGMDLKSYNKTIAVLRSKCVYTIENQTKGMGSNMLVAGINIRTLDLVLYIPCRAYKCYRMKMTSMYHGEYRKYSPIRGPDCL